MVSIIHVTSSLQLGGAERFVIDLASVQRERGIAASILSLGDPGDILVAEAERKQIPLRVYTASTPGSRLRIYAAVYRLFKTADVIHFHSPSVLEYLVPLLLLLPSLKVIYTRHGEGKTELRWTIVHWLVERFVDLATFVSSSARESFLARYNWAADKLLTIENGVYMPGIATARSAYPIRIGSVGRMVELKGQKFLLDAIDGVGNNGGVASLEQPRFELHFFGSGPLESALKQQAAGNSNADSIFFHGTVLDRDSIYDSIDVLVVSSESEGLSLVILEAMARGIPVIATDVGGNPSLVEHEASGYLVPYGDAGAIREALERFLRNPALIETFGEHARAMVLERYSIEKTHQAYLNCYVGEPSQAL